MAHQRCLRQSYHVAHEYHQCAQCPHMILPGDRYEKEIYVAKVPEYDLSFVRVIKSHIECPPDPWDDPDFFREDLEDERTATHTPTKPPLKKAA